MKDNDSQLNIKQINTVIKPTQSKNWIIHISLSAKILVFDWLHGKVRKKKSKYDIALDLSFVSMFNIQSRLINMKTIGKFVWLIPMGIVMIFLFSDSVDTNIVYIFSAGLVVTIDASSLFVDARAGMHLLKQK